MSLNLTKTNYIIFGIKHKPDLDPSLDIVINDFKIARESKVKFLGTYIDEDLKWKSHASYIALKISRSIGIINRLKYILSKDVLRSLYFTLIHPYLLYCNIAWGNASKNVLNRLRILQKKALRLITKSQYRDHTDPLFSSTRIPNLTNIHLMQKCLFMYKYKLNLLPECCYHLIEPARNPPSYAFRNVTYFPRHPCKTNLREKSIFISGAIAWNNLPVDVKNLKSLSSFKKKLFHFFCVSVII